MDIQIIALAIAFGIVSFITVMVIRQNRYYAKLVKQMQKEPTLMGQPAANNPPLKAKKAEEPTLTRVPKPAKEKSTSVILPAKKKPMPVIPTAVPIIEPAIAMLEVEVANPIVLQEKPIIPTPLAANRNLEFPLPAFNVTPREFIVLTLLAKPELPYTGYELLQALLAVGLRFGKMNVFHRHEKASGQGEVLFSLASAVEPGIFELNKMGSFTCRGLTLFLRLSAFQKGDKDLLLAFDLMIETAYQLIDDLGGEVCDEQRQPLTEEKIKDWRSYLAYYERSRQIPDLFA